MRKFIFLLPFFLLLLALFTANSAYAEAGKDCLSCDSAYHLEGTNCIPMYGGVPIDPKVIVCTSEYSYCSTAGNGCCKSPGANCTQSPSGNTLSPCTSPGVCNHSTTAACEGGYSPRQGRCDNGNVCCQIDPNDGKDSKQCDPSKQDSCGTGGTYACLPDMNNQTFVCQSGSQAGPFDQIICGATGSSCKTALGDISTDALGFIRRAFGLILSISGGIALLLIIISGYRILSSQGNPEALKGAREQLTAAIVGLLFIILALVILQIIGYDILRIPAFK